MPRLIACLAVFCSFSALNAAVVTFDFETLGATAGGGLTSTSQTVDGVTLSVARENGTAFDIEDESGFSSLGFPSSWGSRTLSPFADASANAFIGNFSATGSSVSLVLGDFGADTDSVILQAFSGLNGTGTLLGSDSIGSCCDGSSRFSFVTLTVNAPGIQSIRFIGGSSGFPNSLYADNIALDVNGGDVPEPSSIALSLAGFGALAAFARRRRA